MIKTTAVSDVRLSGGETVEDSLDRLLRATDSARVRHAALCLLVTLTGIGHQRKVASVSARTADLEELEDGKFIYRSAPGRVDLI